MLIFEWTVLLLGIHELTYHPFTIHGSTSYHRLLHKQVRLGQGSHHKDFAWLSMELLSFFSTQYEVAEFVQCSWVLWTTHIPFFCLAHSVDMFKLQVLICWQRTCSRVVETIGNPASIGRTAEGLLFIHHLPPQIGPLRDKFLRAEGIGAPWECLEDHLNWKNGILQLQLP